LFTPSEFRDLVSGRQRGAAAAVLRSVLRAAEVPYTAAVRWRNRRYDAAPARRAGVPVVSVGNLTLGGTGKTPMVQWIVGWFRRRGVRVAVISRGYGARAGQSNDEALELEQKLPGVIHLENPDRLAAAATAVGQHDAELIVLDDAFQHRRIHRDLDIVMLDALEPLGFGHVFPRGTLREPVDGLRRADVVALSRADMLEPSLVADLHRRVRSHAPEADWLEVVHAPRCLLRSDGREEPLDSLRDQSVGAFCGIGNPAGFLHTLRSCGYRVTAFREFPDHHGYTRSDIAWLEDWAAGLDAAAVHKDTVLCTHKDLVKLAIDRLGPHPLRALSVEIDFLVGQEELEARLLALLPLVGGKAEN
jgi:tetraacyldisaccharide 4'-kinase